MEVTQVIRYVVLTGEDTDISVGMFETLDSVYAYLTKRFFCSLAQYSDDDQGASSEELGTIESLMDAEKHQEAFQELEKHWRPAEHVKIIDLQAHKDGDILDYESYH